MGITLGYLVFSRLELTWAGAGLAVAWIMAGRGLRGVSHLRRHPQEILLLPLVTLVVIFIALPIKLYAFVTMNKQGWLTRTADLIGGEGQTADTLTPAQRAPRSAVTVPSQLQPELAAEVSR